MEELVSDIIRELKEKNKTVTFMESCTGGALANAITNCPGAASVFKGSSVTYSNEDKVREGVDGEVIEQFGVYSFPVVISMARAVLLNKDADYSIAVSGKLNTIDKSNPHPEDDVIYVCLYDRELDDYHLSKMEVPSKSRKEIKADIVVFAFEHLKNIMSLNKTRK